MSRILPGKPYYRNFGGVNLISGEANLRDFDWSDAQNVQINTAGSVGSRAGTQLVAKAYPLNDNVLAYWRLEATTSTRMDYTANENDFVTSVLAPTGTPGYTDGNGDNHGTGLNIVPGGMETAATTELSLDAQDWSIAFYYKKTVAFGGKILSKIDTPGTPAGGWEIIDNVGTIDVNVWNSTPTLYTVSSTTVFGLNDWHLVVVTYNDTTKNLKIYVDGVLENTTVTTGAWASFSEKIRLGVDRAGASDGNGVVDEIMIVNEELNSPIITVMWNVGIGNGVRTKAEVPVSVSRVCQGLFQFVPTDANEDPIVYMVCGGKILYLRDIEDAFVTMAWPSNYAGDVSETLKWTFAQVFDRVYMGNGSDGNLRIEDNVLWTQGLDEIGTTTVQLLTPVVDGTSEMKQGATMYYWYLVVPVRQVGGGRTIVGRPSLNDKGDGVTYGSEVPIGIVNNAYDITMPAAPSDPGQTHWGLYRFQYDGTPFLDQYSRPTDSFYWVADVPIATVTYRDLKAQSELVATQDSAGDYFEFRQLPPCQYRVGSAIASQGQLLQSGNAADATFCYPSSPEYPDMGIINAYFAPGRDDGDPVQQLAAYYDAFIVFKEDRFFMVVPDWEVSSITSVPVEADFPYRVVEVNRNLGCLAPFSVANLPNKLVWLSDKGFYELTAVDAFGRVKVQEVSKRIEPETLTWPSSRLKKAHAIHFRRGEEGNYRMAVSPSGQSVNNKMWVYEYDQRTPDPNSPNRSGAWHPWSGFTAEYIAQVEVDFREQAWFGDDQGNVMRMDTGRTDYDAATESQLAIDSFLLTKHYDQDALTMTKRWRELELEGLTIAGALQVTWSRDYGQRPGGSKSVQLELVSGDTDALIYDGLTGAYGFTTYQGDTGTMSIAIRTRLHNATGHRIQFRFSQNNLAASWLLHGWILRAVPVQSVRTLRV